MLLLMVDDGLL